MNIHIDILDYEDTLVIFSLSIVRYYWYNICMVHMLKCCIIV